MGCKEFLAGFSDYQDGLLPEWDREAFEGHRASCSTCERYARVVERSREVVRALPTLDVTPEFRDRLEARIQEERALGRLARGPQGSASTTAALAAVAMVFAVIAWLPTLEPVVIETTLPAIAAVPPQRPPVRTRLGSTPFPKGVGADRVVADDFWGDTNALLHQYSSLAAARRSTRWMVRTAAFE